jgi:hypothetical protein
MTNLEMIALIKRKFGFPMIKVELHNDNIIDAMNESKKKWIKWASGNATKEVYFTLLLVDGQRIYGLPTGVVDVVNVDDQSSSTTGGINTLFSIENYLYSQGMYPDVHSSSFNLVDYHLAMDFMTTIDLYSASEYRFTYHKHTNQLEVSPTPVGGRGITVTDPVLAEDMFRDPDSQTIVASGDVTYSSPGYVLVRSYMVAGATLPAFTMSPSGEMDDYLLDEDWIVDYTYALSMRTLGYIRRKLASFNALGTDGVQLDGDSLVSEAETKLQELDDRLRSEEAHEGYGIVVG